MDLSWRIRDPLTAANKDTSYKKLTWPRRFGENNINDDNWRNERKPLVEHNHNRAHDIEAGSSVLRVELLGMMNNESNSSVFEEGPGNLKILRDLSDIFPPGNRRGISINKSMDTKSWIISQSPGGLALRVTKVATEFYQRGEELIQQQGERVEPAHSFLRMNQSILENLGLNIVTSRGVMKKLMTLARPCEIIVCRNEDNVLTIWNEFKPYGCGGIDVSTGTTVEDVLSKEPTGIYEPAKRIYGIFHTRLGGSSVLYHAEVDALKSEVSKDPNQRLSMRDFVEVKTVSSRTLQGKKHNFFRKSLAEWWAQCALAGVEKVVCGVLNEEYQPYTFDSRFIELQKFLHLRVSEFSKKSEEVIGQEPSLWSEASLTNQLQSTLDQVRDRFRGPGIQNGKPYRVLVEKKWDYKTQKEYVYVGKPCEV